MERMGTHELQCISSQVKFNCIKFCIFLVKTLFISIPFDLIMKSKAKQLSTQLYMEGLQFNLDQVKLLVYQAWDSQAI